MGATSKDILFYALTIATLVLTFFLAWFLYHVVSIVRRADGAMRRLTEGVEKIHEILDAIKDAAHKSTGHLALIVGAVRQLSKLYAKRSGGKETDDKDDEDA